MSKLNSLSLSNQRQSNIELLRIIIMFVVVSVHLIVYGKFTFSASEFTFNKFWLQFIRSIGNTLMNVFILISGYFLVSAEKIKVSKVLKLWIQVFTYSILFFAIFVAFGAADFSIIAAVKRILPISFNQWWFASTYFVLYLIHPFINIFIKALNKITYLKFIVLAAVCWSIIPTIFTGRFQSNDLIWFIFIYCVGGYLKLHFDITKISSKKSFLIFFIIYALTMCTVIIFDLIGTRIPTFGVSRHALYLFGRQKFPALLMAIFIFIGFSNLNIKFNKAINFMSPAMFAVYLIHDDKYVRDFIWGTLFHPGNMSRSKLLIPYCFGVSLLVFSVCTGIELLRINVLEKRYMKYISKLSAIIEEKINKFFSSKIFDKI